MVESLHDFICATCSSTLYIFVCERVLHPTKSNYTLWPLMIKSSISPWYHIKHENNFSSADPYTLHKKYPKCFGHKALDKNKSKNSSIEILIPKMSTSNSLQKFFRSLFLDEERFMLTVFSWKTEVQLLYKWSSSWFIPVRSSSSHLRDSDIHSVE